MMAPVVAGGGAGAGGPAGGGGAGVGSGDGAGLVGMGGGAVAPENGSEKRMSVRNVESVSVLETRRARSSDRCSAQGASVFHPAPSSADRDPDCSARPSHRNR